MYEAPADLPAGARWTLSVVASRTRADGSGARVAVETIVTLTGKSERTVRSDIAELAARKVLVRGDGKLVAHLPRDKRPNVWDLSAEAREFIARHRKRGADSAPRRTERGAECAVSGVQKTSQRGADFAPKEFFEENSENGAPPARVAGARDGTPENPPAAGPHPFEPDGVGSESCRHCGLAKPHGRHRPLLRVVP